MYVAAGVSLDVYGLVLDARVYGLVIDALVLDDGGVASDDEYDGVEYDDDEVGTYVDVYGVPLVLLSVGVLYGELAADVVE